MKTEHTDDQLAALADPAGLSPDAATALTDPVGSAPDAATGRRAVAAGAEGVAGQPRADGLGLTEDFGARWQSVQVGFVDAPRQAVEDADQLIAEITDRLLDQFRQQRAELENTWSSGEEVSTEDLRLALQRYRSFLERLLAA